MPEQEKVEAVAVPIETVREAVAVLDEFEEGQHPETIRSRRIRLRLEDMLDGRTSP